MPAIGNFEDWRSSYWEVRVSQARASGIYLRGLFFVLLLGAPWYPKVLCRRR